MKKILLSSAVSILLSTSAIAGDNKWYIGANMGQSEADTGVSTITASLDDTDSAWKIYGGYNFNKYFALEAFYADLGEASLSGNNGDTFTHGGTTYSFTANNASFVTDVQTFGLNLVASYPLHEYFEPFAKFGLHRYDLESTAVASGLSATTVSDDGTDITFGFGFQVPVHENISIVAEWQRFELDDNGESDYLSAGLIYKF